MSLADLQDDAADRLHRLKLTREQIDEALAAGQVEVDAERKKLRAGTRAIVIVERLTEAFARGAAKAFF